MYEKRIGILTSGGDSPGMNAAIRSITRTAVYYNYKIYGIKRGYDGLINSDVIELESRSVSEIIYRGGTMLRSARSEEMRTEEGRKRAAAVYDVLGLDALFIIGGNGTITAAGKLADLGLNIFCIPATIDLDLACTEYTIGFDTAVQTGMEAINKLRDTTSSHERCSVVEVMGRNAGYIALWCAVAGGAEDVLIPEIEGKMEKEEIFDSVIKNVIINKSRGKMHNLIIVAEGVGYSQELAKKIEEVTAIETRATILGHLQRGGSPSALDRMRASRFGHDAVKAFSEGKSNLITVFKDGKHSYIDIADGLKVEKQFSTEINDLVKILAL